MPSGLYMWHTFPITRLSEQIRQSGQKCKSRNADHSCSIRIFFPVIFIKHFLQAPVSMLLLVTQALNLEHLQQHIGHSISPISWTPCSCFTLLSLRVNVASQCSHENGLEPEWHLICRRRVSDLLNASGQLGCGHLNVFALLCFVRTCLNKLSFRANLSEHIEQLCHCVLCVPQWRNVSCFLLDLYEHSRQANGFGPTDHIKDPLSYEYTWPYSYKRRFGIHDGRLNHIHRNTYRKHMLIIYNVEVSVWQPLWCKNSPNIDETDCPLRCDRDPHTDFGAHAGDCSPIR